MKFLKSFVVFLCISIFLGCSTPKLHSDGAYGIKIKTQNPNTPYIYKNGYSNYEIQPALSVQDKDSIYLNELRFNAVYSAKYTKKLMYDKFGKWDSEVYLHDKCHPVLVWEKVKLFENDDTLFYVAADGDENWEKIFASVIVLDENDDDCLSDNYAKKNEIIQYFSNSIKNINKDEGFYSKYREIVPKCKYNNQPGK